VCRLVGFAVMTVLPELVAASPALSSHRVEKTIDREWTYQYYPQREPDLAPAQLGFDDRRWPAIALPHTWSTFETTGGIHPFIEAANEKVDTYWWYGWGWYRKRLVIAPRYSDRLISLEFDGVQKYSKIYVNGEYAGEHKGGYTSFSVDITPFVRFGRENVIAILVSNRRDDPNAIPPMTAGNFDIYGGIYRDVRLVIKDKLHFPFQGSADYEGGTFVTTPRVSGESAQVRVRTWIRNDYAERHKCLLLTSIRDAAGKQIAQLTATHAIEAGQTYEFDQVTTVLRPNLWSPESPYVYTVVSRVFAGTDGEAAADEITSPLGFRWFRWNRSEHRLYLNGVPIVLNGTNRHPEYPWLGGAMPKWMHEKDLKDIRYNLGHNFQRTVHYPNDPYVYQLSDKLGIITVEEVPNIKDLPFSREVQRRNVIEMIRRDRNHPCIFFWSMGNETDRPADSAWAHEQDTTRIIHLRRGTNGGAYVETNNDDIGFEQLLRCTIRGWHDGDRVFPEGGHPKNNQASGTEEWQHDTARAEIIRRCGDNFVVFLYADHGADRKYLYCPLLYVNPKGWVDAYRNPKYMYYLWEANFGSKPVIFIEPHLWRPKYLGKRQDITVDSNCDSVTLHVNRKTIGALIPSAQNGHSVTFKNVLIEQGVLSAEGVRNGVRVQQEVRMPGPPAAIELTASSDTIPAGRNGIATVSANIVDANGVHVIGANPPLTWKVEGAATLVGPSRYETDTDKDWSLCGEMYIDTPVSNVIRSSELPGKIVVTVSAPGLRSGRVVLSAVNPPVDNVPGIVEPALSDSGRVRVTRDLSFKPVVIRTKKAKIAEISQDVYIHADPHKGYDSPVRKFILDRNPGLNDSTPQFGELIDHLVRDLERTHGRLIADDYNFLVRKYNESGAIK
jgi:beta-galactosidase